MKNATRVSGTLAWSLGKLRSADKWCSVTRMTAVLALMLIVSGMVAPVARAQTFYTVKIENKSDWDIHHLYLSPTGQNRWGPDLLGRYILYSDYNFTTAPMAAGSYDLKLVDEDGDVCIVWNVGLYRFTTWSITDLWLLACEFRKD